MCQIKVWWKILYKTFENNLAVLNGTIVDSYGLKNNAVERWTFF